MSFMHCILQKASASKKHIILPEWFDERILEAAGLIVRQGIADVILIGNRQEIERRANGIDISGVRIVQPDAFEKTEQYTRLLFEMRKAKGMTFEKATELMKNPIYFGIMMVKQNDADGMVAGAASSTSDVWRPVLQIIKTSPGVKVASSCFMMEVPDCKYGDDGLLVFADCSLNPNPTAEELASIAVSTANTARTLLGIEPRIAMLSFSTKGSAKHKLVDKVTEATRIAREIVPDLLIDGELQADAALDMGISIRKCPDSLVGGRANILIFPDLQSANIAYKLVQRLAKANAIGPISQGLSRPINDLSRGCTIEDIVNVTAITAVEAQNR